VINLVIPDRPVAGGLDVRAITVSISVEVVAEPVVKLASMQRSSPELLMEMGIVTIFTRQAASLPRSFRMTPSM
jgi:hypothetical protein